MLPDTFLGIISGRITNLPKGNKLPPFMFKLPNGLFIDVSKQIENGEGLIAFANLFHSIYMPFGGINTIHPKATLIQANACFKTSVPDRLQVYSTRKIKKNEEILIDCANKSSQQYMKVYIDALPVTINGFSKSKFLNPIVNSLKAEDANEAMELIAKSQALKIQGQEKTALFKSCGHKFYAYEVYRHIPLGMQGGLTDSFPKESKWLHCNSINTMLQIYSLLDQQLSQQMPPRKRLFI